MFINYPHKKSAVPLRVIVPNLFTTVAMCCGLASIHYSLKGDWDRAVFAVILSAVFDALDGRAARLLKASSSFGEVLDSLADFLSFGVAPAMLLHQWMLKDQDVRGLDALGLMAVTAFVLCSGMRLARFTAAAARPAAPPAPTASAPMPGPYSASSTTGPTDEQRSALVKAKFFTGLATPSAAAAVMVPVMLSYSKHVGDEVRELLSMPKLVGTETAARTDHAPHNAEQWIVLVVIAYTVLIALWMVSRVPMFSFKKMHVSRRAGVPILLAVGVVVMLAVTDFWLLMSGLVLVYLATAPLSWRSHRAIMRGHHAAT